MIEEKYITLMQRHIDGCITGSEERKLEAYLSKNAEARKMDAELHLVVKTLDSVKSVSTPANFKERVLASVQSRPVIVRESATPFAGLLESFTSLFTPKYAYSFSAGAVAGILLLAIYVQFGEGLIDNVNGNMAGAMVNGSSRTFTKVDQTSVNLAWVDGTVQLSESGSALVADINLNSENQVVITVEYDSNALHLEGYRNLTHEPHGFEHRRGFVQFLSQAGLSHQIVFTQLGPSASPIQVKIRQDKNIYETTLTDKRAE